MRQLFLATVAALGLAAAAEAAPIPADSVLNIVGNANFDGATISFTNPSDLVVGAGAFAGLGTCTGCVTMTTPLDYVTPTTGLAYTAMNAGVTTTFDITSGGKTSGSATTLALQFDGIATLTGFDPTPGVWIITANQFGDLIGSFSASTIATPEPVSLLLLGTGLLGLGIVRRRG